MQQTRMDGAFYVIEQAKRHVNKAEHVDNTLREVFMLKSLVE